MPVDRLVRRQAAPEPARHGRVQLGLGLLARVGDLRDARRRVRYPVRVAAARVRRRVVRADHLGFLRVVRVHAEQHRQPLARRQHRRRGRRTRHDHRRMRPGLRARHHRNLPEPKQRPRSVHPLPGQPAHQQLDGLLPAGLLVARQTGAEDLQVDPRAAASDPEREPAAGELVEQCGLFTQ
jgi:hypothetical protein